jgi:hypothetical protein
LQQPVGHNSTSHWHFPLAQCPTKQNVQRSPPVPQAALSVPDWQTPLLSQQPVQVCGEQAAGP